MSDSNSDDSDSEDNDAGAGADAITQMLNASSSNFQRKVKPWEALLEEMSMTMMGGGVGGGDGGMGSIRGQLQENR